MLINDLFHQIGMILKEADDCAEYLLESFPVPICDNIRIFNVKLIESKEYRGYIASKKRYFYGVRVQLLTTKSGIPVEFVFMPGSASDVRTLNALPLNLHLVVKYMLIQAIPITLLRMTWKKVVKYF
jgi:hypothetical protein